MAKFIQLGKIMQLKIRFLSITFLFLLTSCASYDFSRRIVEQGNLLPDQKISRLHLGMSKADTAILMGTSLLSPSFNNNRWDYAYTWRKGAAAPTTRHLSLYFAQDKLVKIEPY